MPRVFVFLLVLASAAWAGLGEHATLVAAEAANARPARCAVRVTYHRVNGSQFETAGRALLVDPDFTCVLPGGVAGLGTSDFSPLTSHRSPASQKLHLPAS